MITLTIQITEEEHEKLKELAEKKSTPKKKMTIEDCIRDFAKSCQPDGSGWVHPAMKQK